MEPTGGQLNAQAPAFPLRRRKFPNITPMRSEPMADEDIGAPVVAALGDTAARELLTVLERSDADRAKLIGRLYARDDARWLAELLMDLEDDIGEVARLRLIASLRLELGAAGTDSR